MQGSVRHRRSATLALTLLVGVVAACAFSAVAAAQSTSTITHQDCVQGRIRNSAGRSISRARCDQLVGRNVQLASTGLDAWLIGLAGVGCIVGAVALWRPLHLAGRRH